jgi:di/tricarboxylate transporter
MALQFGDALLLYGPWEKLIVLGQESNFLVLTETVQELLREEKAKVVLIIMAAVMLSVIMGWIPIYIGVVIGAAVMVLTQCLTMEEAYRYSEWKAVFLIAGRLPLGTAFDKFGAESVYWPKAFWVHWGLSARRQSCLSFWRSLLELPVLFPLLPW